MTEPIDLFGTDAELLASAAESNDGGRAASTVLHEPGLRPTVIALRAAHELAEHDEPPAPGERPERLLRQRRTPGGS